MRSIGAEKISTRMLLPQRYHEHKTREILSGDAIVIGFQPGAANIYKMWPIENFKELADMILAEYPNA